MTETHRLSYVGDPVLVNDLVRVLGEEGVVTHGESVTIADQTSRDPTQEEPLTMVVGGAPGVAASSISRAIVKFADQFPGRAQVRDDGAMPTSHVLVYTGSPRLAEAFISILWEEGVEVHEPENDDDWPSVSEQLARADGTPIMIHAVGLGDIADRIQTAITTFHERFPEQAQAAMLT